MKKIIRFGIGAISMILFWVIFLYFYIWSSSRIFRIWLNEYNDERSSVWYSNTTLNNEKIISLYNQEEFEIDSDFDSITIDLSENYINYNEVFENKLDISQLYLDMYNSSKEGTLDTYIWKMLKIKAWDIFMLRYDSLTTMVSVKVWNIENKNSFLNLNYWDNASSFYSSQSENLWENCVIFDCVQGIYSPIIWWDDAEYKDCHFISVKYGTLDNDDIFYYIFLEPTSLTGFASWFTPGTEPKIESVNVQYIFNS